MKKKLFALVGASLACVGLLTGCLRDIVPPDVMDLLFGASEQPSSSLPASSSLAQVSSKPSEVSSFSSAPSSEAPREEPAIGTEELPGLYNSLEGQWMDENQETVLAFDNYDGYYWVGLGFAYSEYVGEYRVLGVEKHSDTVYTLHFDLYNRFEISDTDRIKIPRTVQDSITIDLGAAGDSRFTVISSIADGSEQLSRPLDYTYDPM